MVIANIDLRDKTLSNIDLALAHRLRSRNIDLILEIDLALVRRSHLRRPETNLKPHLRNRPDLPSSSLSNPEPADPTYNELITSSESSQTVVMWQ
jgi:hypothetical protein